MAPIRVLVVDDSAFMRHAVGRLIGEAGDLVVVGSASNGEEGLKLAASLKPDVITLDVEMPVLDGPGMLRRLMVETPTRVVMLSSLTTQGAAVTLDALDSGAIDFVAKPGGSLSIPSLRHDPQKAPQPVFPRPFLMPVSGNQSSIRATDRGPATGSGLLCIAVHTSPFEW